MVDWALSNNYLSIFYMEERRKREREKMVDWALSNNYLSIYFLYGGTQKKEKDFFFKLMKCFQQNEANQQGQVVEVPEPHLKETYEDKSVFDDAAAIIVHNMKRQSSKSLRRSARSRTLFTVPPPPPPRACLVSG